MGKVSETRNTVKQRAKIFGFIFHNAPGWGGKWALIKPHSEIPQIVSHFIRGSQKK